jgi:ABC-type nitrate/sulfonate/bicarbonate transport system ATPase subunit
VVVLTARPGTVKEIVAIDTPRPRNPISTDLRNIEAHIRDLIGETAEDG